MRGVADPIIRGLGRQRAAATLTVFGPPRNLNWWARNRAVRAKHATVAGKRLQQRPATCAVIEVLTGVREHCFGRLMATVRASQHRFKLWFDHAPNVVWDRIAF